MYKRIEKKRKRVEKEETLGLDEDMKEVLGLNDTDSDETDTDSQSGENSEGEEERDSVEGGGGVDESGSVLGSEDEGEEGLDVVQSRVDDPEQPTIAVKEVLEDPIYLVSMDPEVRACIICKGKSIKNIKMADLHRQSMAHQRRFSRFKALANRTGLDEDAWLVVEALQIAANRGDKPAIATKASDGISNRGEKRKAKLEAIKGKRQLQNIMKVKAKAKKEAKLQVGLIEEPKVQLSPKHAPPRNSVQSGKKRKLDEGLKSEKTTKSKATPAPPKKNTDNSTRAKFHEEPAVKNKSSKRKLPKA